MARPELHWLGVADAARMIRAGEVSPVEIVEDTLRWIEITEPVVHNYVTLMPDQALADAKVAEQEIRSGNDKGPFHGITFTVKDVIAVGGVPMKCNSELAKDFLPKEDSFVVKKMRAAGAVCLGKVATHEFSWGVTCQPARNPWDGESAVGGSSGGSGSAVAAGQCASSLGADCGCSVRNPAAFNGVCGMRVSYGRIGTSGSVPLSMTMDTIGPLARSVEDMALMLNAAAGWDPDDPTSSSAPVPDFTAKLGQSIKGMKVGVPTNHFFEHIEPGVERLIRAAIEQLDELGAKIVEIEIPHAKYQGGAFIGYAVAESAALMDEYTHFRAAELGIDVRNFIELGNLLLAKDYCRAQQVRALIRQDFERAFEKVDVIVTPVAAATAKPMQDHPVFITVEYPDGYTEDLIWASCRYTVPVSMSGCPGVVVPVGLSDDGKPTGMQIVPPAFDEQTALQVAYAYEQATEWHKLRPTRIGELAAA